MKFRAPCLPDTMLRPFSEAAMTRRVPILCRHNQIKLIHYFVYRRNHPIAVWNGQPVAESVAPRVFERYVTTNPEPGHGLGTYSMKLLGERYLRGEVSFQSSEADGTVFSISLPRRIAV